MQLGFVVSRGVSYGVAAFHLCITGRGKEQKLEVRCIPGECTSRTSLWLVRRVDSCGGCGDAVCVDETAVPSSR